MDIFEGLSLDLHRLCQASNVGAVIYENLIPVSRDAKSPDEALTMGEDFELLFVMALDEAKRLSRNCGKTFIPNAATQRCYSSGSPSYTEEVTTFGMPLETIAKAGARKAFLARFKAIGEIREKSCGVKIVTKNLIEKVLEPKGYQHFQENRSSPHDLYFPS